MTVNLRLFFAEYADGDFLITDIKENLNDKVINYMYENYCLNNKIFQQLGYLEEENIFENYASYVRHLLRNDMSIVVVDPKDNIYGVVLLKWMNEEWRSWTALLLSIIDGKMIDIINLYIYIVNQFGVDKMDTMQLFEMYLDEQLRTEEFYKLLFECIYKVAQLAHKKCITTIALTEQHRNHLIENGYEKVNSIIYPLYTLQGERHGERPFATLRDIGEFKATLLKMDINAFVPFYEMPLTQYRHQQKKKKKTRFM